jgi:chaperonin GroEL
MKLTSSNPEKIIKSAVEKYVKFIAPTYGPAGKKTLIVTNEFNHEAVDDGKRSSQAFELEDELENAVVQYIKETTQKGKDGTTTAGLIMGNIVLEALKDIDDVFKEHDYHGMYLSLKKGVDEAVKQLTKASRKIKTKEELYDIAYNSYNDEKLAKLVADTIFEIGKDGVLSIEDSRSTETTVEIVNGLEIPKGYHSPYFINIEDKVVLENPLILLINKKVNLFSELLPIFTTINANNQRVFINPDITIVAEGFGEDVINGFIASKITGRVRPLLIETPSFGDKLENLSDIGIIIGARVVDDKTLKLADVKREHLGTCESVKATKDKTTFLGGGGKTKDYITALKIQLEVSTNNFEKDKLTQRIAVLSGGVAVIKVGAYTENEQKSIKTKVENAVNSTQIAYRGGVVEGAGKALDNLKTSSELLNTALKAPREQLEKNGLKYLDEDAVDPTDVVITALQAGVSIAGGLLTMGGISVPKRKEDKDNIKY